MLWKNRSVWIILSGELIAGIGLWTGIIGNLEFMQEKIPSDFVKALILSVGLLAGIIAGPLAGRIIDQQPKKKILIAAGAGRLVSVVFMLIALAIGSVWWMVAFVVSIQLAATFYFPALQAAIPLVVQEGELLTMNGLHMNVSTIARVAGTAFAGMLLVYWPLSSLYWISLAAYAALLIFTWMLRIDDEGERGSAADTGRTENSGFLDVFPVLKAYPAVGMTLVMTLIPLLFLGAFNLIVINVSEIQQSASIKGLIYTCEGVAFMIGSFAVKRIAMKWRTAAILFFFASMVGGAEFLLYFTESRLAVLAAFSLLGFSLGCFFPTAMVIFQKQMPKAYHGRFFSFRNMLERVMFQVVLLATGAFLDIVGLQLMVLVFGMISIGLTAIFYVQMKRRNIGLEEPAADSNPIGPVKPAS